jgi:hypothetical protein
MDRFLVMAALRLILWGAMASITAGCFDVHTVAPGRRLIDDFTNPDGDPTDPSFERWACRPVDETHQVGNDDCNSNITSIDGHLSVLHLGATLIPGDSLFTRAELITYAEMNQDLTPYAKFWFSWELVSRDPPLSASTHLKVQLTCTSVRDADGSVQQNPRVIWTVSTPTTGWQESSGGLLAPDGFGPPEDFQTINQHDCLAHVDGIKVTVESDPMVPQHAGFDLFVDDISLEPKE